MPHEHTPPACTDDARVVAPSGIACYPKNHCWVSTKRRLRFDRVGSGERYRERDVRQT